MPDKVAVFDTTASSPEDFEAVQLISREIEGPVICALSRAVSSVAREHRELAVRSGDPVVPEREEARCEDV